MAKQQLDYKTALEKARRYCAIEERCHQQVRDKLYDYGLHRKEVEEGIAELIGQDFLNEERYARAYAGGKFRQQKWGRIKIQLELKRRKISTYCIRKGMEEIGEEEYRETLRKLMIKKEDQLTERNPFIRKQKTAAFVIRKGYEPELVWKILKSD